MKCSQVFFAACLVGSAAVQANPLAGIAKKAVSALTHHKTPHPPAHHTAPKVAQSAKIAKFKGAALKAGSAARKAGNSAIKAAGGHEQAATSAANIYMMWQQHKQQTADANAANGAVERRALSDEELVYLVARLLREEDDLYTRGYYDFELNELD